MSTNSPVAFVVLRHTEQDSFSGCPFTGIDSIWYNAEEKAEERRKTLNETPMVERNPKYDYVSVDIFPFYTGEEEYNEDDWWHLNFPGK